MGMKLSDFSVVEKNLQGKNKPVKNPRENKIINTKGKFCHGCGFQIKSAIVRNMFFVGDWCVDCFGER